MQIWAAVIYRVSSLYYIQYVISMDEAWRMRLKEEEEEVVQLDEGRWEGKK
jgi:hypothetical protein